MKISCQETRVYVYMYLFQGVHHMQKHIRRSGTSSVIRRSVSGELNTGLSHDIMNYDSMIDKIPRSLQLHRRTPLRGNRVQLPVIFLCR